MTSSRHIALVYKALGEETRIRMVNLLAEIGEVCVCDLESALEITQSKTSRHLRVLKEADIVVDRREGAWIYYRVHDDLSETAREAVATLRRTYGRSQEGERDVVRARRSSRVCQ